MPPGATAGTANIGEHAQSWQSGGHLSSCPSGPSSPDADRSLPSAQQSSSVTLTAMADEIPDTDSAKRRTNRVMSGRTDNLV